MLNIGEVLLHGFTAIVGSHGVIIDGEQAAEKDDLGVNITARWIFQSWEVREQRSINEQEARQASNRELRDRYEGHDLVEMDGMHGMHSGLESLSVFDFVRLVSLVGI